MEEKQNRDENKSLASKTKNIIKYSFLSGRFFYIGMENVIY